MRRFINIVIPLTFLALSQAAPAETVVPGRLLASNCFQCHGTDGRPVAGLANLAGESASSLYNKMFELCNKTDPGIFERSIMNVHACGYTAQQLRDIAVYFSKLPH